MNSLFHTCMTKSSQYWGGMKETTAFLIYWHSVCHGKFSGNCGFHTPPVSSLSN